MNTPNDDWSGLDALWRTQPVDPPDLDILRREAAAGRRRARLLDLLDIGAVAVAAIVVARLVATSPVFGTREIVTVAFFIVGLLFAVWTVRNRRMAATDDLAPQALVAVEIGRAQAARRFWRVNTRVMLGLWCVLAALAAAQLAGVPGVPRGNALWIAMLVNVPLVVGSLLWARRRERVLHARLERLEAVGRQFDA